MYVVSRHQSSPAPAGEALVHEGWARVRTGPAYGAEDFALFCEDPVVVELAGIEPASSSVEPGLLRVQSVMSSSQSRRSH